MSKKKNLSSKKLETGSLETAKESKNISLDTIKEIVNRKTIFIEPNKKSYAVLYKNKIVDLPGPPFNSKEEALDALRWVIDYEVWVKYTLIYDSDKSIDKGPFEMDPDISKKIENVIKSDFKIIRILESTKVI